VRSAIDDICGNGERYWRISASKLRVVEVKLIICASVARIICNRTIAIINRIGALRKERNEVAARAGAIDPFKAMARDLNS